MSLNAIIRHMETDENGNQKLTAVSDEEAEAVKTTRPLNDKEREYAERIFFEKQLRELNPGMREEKILKYVQKSVAVAKLLYKELYGNNAND